jgi:hypothetical protein|tara:strand:+ start:286 stop:1869 length:1584 start_codon:yes stop_codon:yes gene_type:complete
MAKEKNKSITEEALLDLKTIQEALKANGKEILRSTMKGEIEEIVKESIEDMDYEEEEIDDTESYDSEPAGEEGEVSVEADGIDNETDVEIDADMEGGESYDDMEGGDLEGDYEDAEMDLTGSEESEVIQIFKKLSGDDQIEIVGDTITLTVDEPGEYVIKTGGDESTEAGYEGGEETEAGYEDDVVGLDVDAEAGIEGDEIEGDIEADIAIDGEAGEEGKQEEAYEQVYEIEIEEGEQIAEDETKIGATANGKVRGKGHDTEVTDSSLPTGDIEGQTAEKDSDSGDNLDGGFVADEATTGDGHSDHVMESDDADADDEDETLTEVEVDCEDEDEIDENSVRALNNGGNASLKPQNFPQERVPDGRPYSKKGKATNESVANAKVLTEAQAKNKSLLAENTKLIKEKAEITAIVKKFRNMLKENVVYTTSLSYVTKLFTEHAFTKAEKSNIVKRFDDEVVTIREAKTLYKSIVSEMATKTTVKESVSKIVETGSKSSSKSNLNESTAYSDPSTSRIMDLISRVENSNKY